MLLFDYSGAMPPGFAGPAEKIVDKLEFVLRERGARTQRRPDGLCSSVPWWVSGGALHLSDGGEIRVVGPERDTTDECSKHGQESIAHRTLGESAISVRKSGVREAIKDPAGLQRYLGPRGTGQ
jgi:hypothetical protein